MIVNVSDGYNVSVTTDNIYPSSPASATDSLLLCSSVSHVAIMPAED